MLGQKVSGNRVTKYLDLVWQNNTSLWQVEAVSKFSVLIVQEELRGDVFLHVYLAPPKITEGKSARLSKVMLIVHKMLEHHP